MSSAKVLLADDHALVRHGIRLIFEAEPEFEVVAEAGDGAEAIAQLRERQQRGQDVDLAVLDVAMPRMTGLQAAREIARRWPRTKILMLSMHDNEGYFFESLKIGAAGYVLKSVADRDLITACRGALRDEPFLTPGMTRAIVATYLERLRRGERLPKQQLTPRETEVTKLIAEGYSSQDIADALTISLKTVERHRSNILTTLGLRDRTQLTRYAIRAGLIEP